MFDEPRFRYPSDESGREQMLRDAYRIADRARAYLPKSFATLPRAEFTIEPMPAHLEAGAAGGLYDPPSLDGSRPGVFWINLEDRADTSSFLLSTILHHEGLPGHHLQFSLAYQAADLPLALKLWDFTAYTEGWAMYAEQLADEWGLYDDESWSRIGYLQQVLLRAARLVVDTGLHAMRWSRAQALRYFSEVLGSPELSNTAEVNRYCVQPAQACSYMVGELAWLRLRERARNELGEASTFVIFTRQLCLGGHASGRTRWCDRRLHPSARRINREGRVPRCWRRTLRIASQQMLHCLACKCSDPIRARFSIYAERRPTTCASGRIHLNRPEVMSPGSICCPLRLSSAAVTLVHCAVEH